MSHTNRSPLFRMQLKEGKAYQPAVKHWISSLRLWRTLYIRHDGRAWEEYNRNPHSFPTISAKNCQQFRLGPQMQPSADFYCMSFFPFHSNLLVLESKPDHSPQTAPCVVQHICQVYSSLAREVGPPKRPGHFQTPTLLGRKPRDTKSRPNSSSFQDALLTYWFMLDVFSFPDL